MNIERMEKFEQLWSVRHDLPAESLVQYRFESREGYRLPELAAHYRTYCDVLDSIVIQKPDQSWIGTMDEGYWDIESMDWIVAIEAAGLRIAG